MGGGRSAVPTATRALAVLRGPGLQVRLCPDSLRDPQESFLLHTWGQAVASPSKGDHSPPRSHRHAVQASAVALAVTPSPQRLPTGWGPALSKGQGREGTGWPQWGWGPGAAAPSPTSVNRPPRTGTSFSVPGDEVFFPPPQRQPHPPGWAVQPGRVQGCRGGREAKPLPQPLRRGVSEAGWPPRPAGA